MSNKPPDQMTLIYLRQTRQVLAVATRTAVPVEAADTDTEALDQQTKVTPEQKNNSATELKTLVGTDLLVRNLPVTVVNPSPPPPILAAPQFLSDGLSFPVSDLGVITTELDLLVTLKSQSYFIDEKKKTQLALAPAAIAFVASATEIKISLATAVASDTGIWIQIYVKNSADSPRTRQAIIEKEDPDPKNKEKVLAEQLTTGTTYQFLVSVQGYAPVLYEKTI